MDSRGSSERVLLERGLLSAALLMIQRDGMFPAPPSTQRVAARLERAGLVQHDRPTNLARRLLGPIAKPEMVVALRDVDARGRRATIWRAEEAATVGFCVADATYALDTVESGLLGFSLAGLMELHIGTQLERSAVFIDRASISAMRSTGRVRHWHISAVSSVSGEVSERDIELLDCGTGGYWEVAEIRAGSLMLEPRSLEAVLHLLDDVLASGC